MHIPNPLGGAMFVQNYSHPGFSFSHSAYDTTGECHSGEVVHSLPREFGAISRPHRVLRLHTKKLTNETRAPPYVAFFPNLSTSWSPHLQQKLKYVNQRFFPSWKIRTKHPKHCEHVKSCGILQNNKRIFDFINSFLTLNSYHIFHSLHQHIKD
jgi:hypothetical protein